MSSKDELNDYGVFISDVYVLNYYGILVFFQVCKTTEKTVFLVELGTKKYKNGITLLKGLKASKNPLIITKNNTIRKTEYEVFPQKDLSLPIQIDFNTPIYKKALEHNNNVLIGIFYAKKILDFNNVYWVVTEENINGYA